MNLNLCKLTKKNFLLLVLGMLFLVPVGAKKRNFFSTRALVSKSTTEQRNFLTDETWVCLEQAKREYDSGNLSKTVVLANKAMDKNAAYYISLRNKIQNALNTKSLKLVGDKITDVYNKFYDQGQADICKCFDEIFLQQSIKSLGNSVKNLLEYLNRRAYSLPESSYLVGLVFQDQGEYNQAKNYFTRAWSQRSFLGNPDEKLNILYSLAEVHEIFGDYQTAEKFLLAILAEDELYGNKTKYSSQLNIMLKSIKDGKPIEKFFLLYRHSALNILKVTQMLTSIYQNTGDYEKALEVSACAACIVTTELENYVKQKNFLFKYKNLEHLILKASKDHVVNTWANEHKFWDTYLQFANILYTMRYLDQAENVYTSVASSVPDYYITQKATYAIHKINALRDEMKAIRKSKEEAEANAVEETLAPSEN